MDHICKATFQIKEILANISEGSLVEQQERDIFKMVLPGLDVLGKLNPAHQGTIFTPVDLVKSDMEPLVMGLDVSPYFVFNRQKF